MINTCRPYALLLVISNPLLAAPGVEPVLPIEPTATNPSAQVLPLPEPALSVVADEPIGVELPPVDASIFKVPKTHASSVPSDTSVPQQHIQVKPGINELMPIAIGHLNRLVTPFENPVVTTTSQATTSTKGKIVYVATADETPVTLYITPGDNQDIALSLTLIPKRIPAREIHLSLDHDTVQTLSKLQQKQASATSLPASQEQSYITQLKNLFRDLGLQKTPAGFALREPSSAEHIHCQQNALSIQTGQALEDQDRVVLVGVARNTGLASIELDERSCVGSGDDVLAVAAWPKVVLAPKETTEVYLVVRRSPDDATSLRPSLLNRSNP
jgi:conjugal transfer pilus assembly protein TraK